MNEQDAKRLAEIDDAIARADGETEYDSGDVYFLRRLLRESEAEVARLKKGFADINKALGLVAEAEKRGYLQGVKDARAGTVTAANDVMDFARAILHGDEQHRKWLLEAAAAWQDGKSPRRSKHRRQPTRCSGQEVSSFTGRNTLDAMNANTERVAAALDAADRAGYVRAIEDAKKAVTQHLAITAAVLVGKPCRDEICRKLADVNKDLRALAAPTERKPA